MRYSFLHARYVATACLALTLILPANADTMLKDASGRTVEVKDNGVGMGAQDRTIVGSAHATSKIGTFLDIYHNSSTYGFRGEVQHTHTAHTHSTHT